MKSTPTSIKYQFTAVLNNPTMHIWRRFFVNENMRLSDFAYFLISIFGGQAEHLYSFTKGNTIFDCGIDKDTYYDDKKHVVAMAYRLSDVLDLNIDTCMAFEYDFGDSWRITLILEDMNGYGEKKQFHLIDGAGFGLIEDCGGTFALSEIADLKEKNFPKYMKEYGDWIEDAWNIDPKGIDFTGKIDVKEIEERARKDLPEFKRAYEVN